MAKKYSDTVGLILTHNNSHIVGAVERLFEAGISDVVVVIDEMLDQGSTVEWLHEVKPVKGCRLHVRSEVRARSLVREMMDVGFSAARGQKVTEARGSRAKYVLCVAAETLVQPGHVIRMHETMESPAEEGGLPCGVVGIGFEGVVHGNKVVLGRTHSFPRLACSLFNLDALNHGFRNRSCTEGCEDFEFLVYMLSEGIDYRMVPEKVRLIVGQHHHVATLARREEELMEKILRFYEHAPDMDNPDRIAARTMRRNLALSA
jgi:hypothetical protein